jgi:hypothetical protein
MLGGLMPRGRVGRETPVSPSYEFDVVLPGSLLSQTQCGHCSSYNTTVIEGPFDGIENAPPLPESDRVHLEEMAADEPEDELWEDIEGEDD